MRLPRTLRAGPFNNPLAGTKQRRSSKALRNIGLSATDSARALNVAGTSLGDIYAIEFASFRDTICYLAPDFADPGTQRRSQAISRVPSAYKNALLQ